MDVIGNTKIIGICDTKIRKEVGFASLVRDTFPVVFLGECKLFCVNPMDR